MKNCDKPLNNHPNLFKKTREFAQESTLLSYWYSLSTLGLLVALMAFTFFSNVIWLKFIGSFLTSLLVLRCFILFHDFQHKAIFRDSKIAPYVFGFFGLYMFTPPSVWRKSHNFHHAHNTILDTSYIGSFWTVSVSEWQKMPASEQLKYRIIRHPAVIVFGLFSVFIYDHCFHSFVQNPRKNWHALLALGLHIGVLLIASYFGEWINYLMVWILPLFIAGLFGTYLFYAQHNFPQTKLSDKKNWDFVTAALDGSSFIRMPKIMHWFTGNIAYHHIHHLNPRIPFYRLPEAMQEIEELQHPKTTSLHWRDIAACLRLKLWDDDQKRMVAIKDLPITT